MNSSLMHLVYRHLFTVLWLLWLCYWWVLARRAKAVVRSESALSRLLHIGPLLISVLLLWLPHLPVSVLGARFMPLSAWAFWLGAALTVTGLLFSVWARNHIGGNWSAIVTIKQDHQLITSGPYALVRHPIYTGLLLAFIGSALARGEWRGVLAVLIAFWAFWRKLRLEERWMQEKFGAAYSVYSSRVAALIPFIL
jgi:protein-S-isoprenylcysteine O-methyltransferase Ste14